MVRTFRGRLPAGFAIIGAALLGLLAASGPTVVGPIVAGPRGPSVVEPADGHEPPPVWPRPQQLAANGGDVHVSGTVVVRAAAEVDDPTRNLVVSVLKAAGADRVDVVDLADGNAPTSQPAVDVVVGPIGNSAVAAALRAAGGSVPGDLPAEGYALASRAAPGGRDGGAVVLAGADSDGTYYAAQTLRQLAGHHALAAVSVLDNPLMRLRGVIEGFYGSPWTQAERLDLLAFAGQLKMNTYVYAPKDDPYHREKWRDPYPADKLAQLGALVDQANAHHVRFTFAVSPGVSICYSDPADIAALEAKLGAMYELGVRSFSIPLDDISYTKWNCDGDASKYGPPSAAAAAQAHVDLLNAVQKDFLDTRAGNKPLQMVPTEYGDVKETTYKSTIRAKLDPRIEIMWTGTDVIPPDITVADASKAAAVWGRKVFVWDNYPVNDYGQAEGRLLLAPYAQREPGLHEQLSGIVLNPMNQEAASKVALFGGADFTWHDTGYTPGPTSTAAAEYLSGGDHATVQALLAFFDLEHLAPTFGSEPWQPQAPELARRLAEFRATWNAGDKDGAVRALRPYADLIAHAPAQIRRGVTDDAFVADCQPWLDALSLWGKAFVDTLDALQARLDGDDDAATRGFDSAAELADQASKIETIPGETRPQGPVRVGDGVLDTFLSDAPDLH